MVDSSSRCFPYGSSSIPKLRRVARWNGAVINGTPDDLRERIAAIQILRTTSEALAIIIEGETPHGNIERAQQIVQPYAEAGAPWWMESIVGKRGCASFYYAHTHSLGPLTRPLIRTNKLQIPE